jgi:hypothetical protein
VNNKIFLKEFSEILATHTRKKNRNISLGLDSQQWRKILHILSKVIGTELAKDNCIYLPFGEYSTTENTQQIVKKSINGQINVPIKYKRRAVCSCARHFKEIINSDT